MDSRNGKLIKNIAFTQDASTSAIRHIDNMIATYGKEFVMSILDVKYGLVSKETPKEKRKLAKVG